MMPNCKKIRLFIAFFVVMCLPPVVVSGARQSLNLNRDWAFQLGDVNGAANPEFDDSGWNCINLPHNFSIPYFQTAHWYTGYGWYRKHIFYSKGWSGKSVFLEFEGAFRVAEIFVNGVKAGEHKGGYTGFSIDITRWLKKGDNVLAVRLNNLYDPALAPRNGDHNFTGGIYRDVHLTVTDPVHVSWYGTFITTPFFDKGNGTVRIRTEIANQSKEAKNYNLVTKILDPDGKEITEIRSYKEIPAFSVVEFDQTTSPVPDVKLWHPQHPFLYKAVNYLMDGKRVVDEYSTTFGFRWYSFSADQGFFLNGARYYFKGANVHQDQAGWASAVTNADIVRDVRMVKDCGMDFIRGSHYPHDPSFSDACDSLGLLLWQENDFWGSGGNQQENNNWFEGSGAYPLHTEDRAGFEESVRSDLREMIRIHRNHPSIIVWSMCNEPFFTDWRTLPQVRTFLKELVNLSHSLDPTRPAGIGGCQRGGIDTLGDVAGYNGDGARLFIHPGIPSVVTEYGSTIAKRPGKLIPGRGDLQQEKFDWRSGEALWCAFDYGTRAGDFGLMGMVDYFRTPKNMWYWYRQENLGIAPPQERQPGIPAVLKMAADKLLINNTNGTDGIRIEVSVADSTGKGINNSPDLTIRILSGPGEFATGRSIRFGAQSDCYIRDGIAAATFRSYEGGITTIVASSNGLKPDTICVKTLGQPVFQEGKTRLVTERPYQRFLWRKANESKDYKTNLAGLKPTRASSEMPGKTADKANDTDTTSGWFSSVNDKEQWWQLDLENLYTIESVSLHLNPESTGGFMVLGSSDAQTWNVLNQVRANHSEQVKIKDFPGLIVRFIRIQFNSKAGTLSGIYDVNIQGEAASDFQNQ